MPVIVGYYQSWKRYQNFPESKINPHLCTHLIYAFVGIKDNRIHFNDKYGDLENGGIKKFNDLKKLNPRLKTLLAVGGWEEGAKSFSDMAMSFNSRQIFIDSCLKVLEKYKFDGIDLDWEYPGLITRGGRPEDKENFRYLVKEMSKSFREDGYLLTVAVGVGDSTVKTAYNIPKISRYVDFIHLMTYDMHSYDTKRVNHHAPLYSTNQNSVSDAVHAWIEAGADKKKLVLGIAAYGRAFTLTDPEQTSIGSPSSGCGKKDFYDYNEIREMYKSGWKRGWDKKQHVPYIYKRKEWIGYDDPDSVTKKIELVKRYGLGGVMLWAIDSDVPSGKASLLAAMSNL